MYFKRINYFPYPEEWKGILKEDAKTFIHNLWTRDLFGWDMFNFKKLDPRDFFALCFMLPWAYLFPVQILVLLLSMFLKYKINPIDRLDRSYFLHHYQFTPKIEKKLLGIIKSKYSKGSNKAVRFNINKKYTGMEVKGEFNDFQVNNKYKVDLTDKKSLGQAIGDSIDSTSTYWNLMDGKDNMYILFIRFDSHQIYNVYVVSYGEAYGGFGNEFILTDIQEFRKIDPKEYTKQ